jgi:acetoin utilization deacetylase AcuC-like enzyme
MKQFNPDMIFIDSGFDSAIGDSMGCQKVTKECFGLMTKEILKVCSKVVCYCNDGYANTCIFPLEYVVDQFLGLDLPDLPENDNLNSELSKNTKYDIFQILKIQHNYWDCLEENYKNLKKEFSKEEEEENKN